MSTAIKKVREQAEYIAAKEAWLDETKPIFHPDRVEGCYRMYVLECEAEGDIPMPLGDVFKIALGTGATNEHR